MNDPPRADAEPPAEAKPAAVAEPTAEAEALVGTEPHAEGAGVCDNCGHAPVEAYCSACGQRNVPLRQPVHRFLADSITEYFGIDGRLWASLRLMVLRPGALTNEYLAGRRVRHLRPLRLYLSATLVFFFLLAALDPVGELERFVSSGIETEDGAADSTLTAAAYLAAVDSSIAGFDAEVARLEALADSLAGTGVLTLARDSLDGNIESFNVRLDELPAEYRDELRDFDRIRSGGRQRALRRLLWQRDQLATMAPDSMIRLVNWMQASELVIPGGGEVNINLPDWMPQSQSVERLRTARTSAQRGEALADFIRNMIQQIPTVMFLLLPVFALLLKTIYARRGWYYSEHLVFALHTHAFAFLVFAVIAVLVWASGGAGWASTTAVVLALGIPVYFFIAQKSVYRQGWFKTAVKALLLGAAYSVLLGFGIVTAFLLAAAV